MAVKVPVMTRKVVAQRLRHSAAKSLLNDSLPCIVPCSYTLVLFANDRDGLRLIGVQNSRNILLSTLLWP